MKISGFFLLVLCFLLPDALSAQSARSSQEVFAGTLSIAKSPTAWPTIRLASPDGAMMQGMLGRSLQRGVHRLALAPYTTDWLLADVSFKVDRIFTNYSGDVSGRFLELAMLTSPAGQLLPFETLPTVLKTVVDYQKPDGHFGVNVDFSKPLKRNSPEITLLWGNARMLVGLITAARKLGDAQSLASARRLGDFYVNTADQLCSPEREAEYHATGTAADSYQVGYFPAMEGLVMLYGETRDERYLQLAERMAKWFLRFDTLPLDHSHGNLSAWRSRLDLYHVTGKKLYLEEAMAKWDKAVDQLFVWSLGGVGEHWHISYNGSEGCSESDWLRFNLDLWRYTGRTRYLDMAERLLENQYIADQSINGGFGMRHFDGEARGPIGTFGAVNEWDFCCSFHGPLGLYFLKSYLATGSEKGIYVNFPWSFTTRVKAAESEWEIVVQADSVFNGKGEKMVDIQFNPDQINSPKPATLWFRVPSWASEVMVDHVDRTAEVRNGYLDLKHDCEKETHFVVILRTKPIIEGRRFTSTSVEPGKISRFRDISLIFGSKVLFEMPVQGPHLSTLLATVDEKGRVDLLRNADGGFISVNISDADTTKNRVLYALESGKKVSLVPWPVPTTRRTAFSYNLLVVPANFISKEVRSKFASRLQDFEIPHYGANLEKRMELWPATLPWNFKQTGILITGGNIGLMEGQGYKDYRFEFDLLLPKEGQGITGWIVRAKSEDDCMMFQLQSGDSPYNAPPFKTRQNTLRPISRKNGMWNVEEPVPLPRQIRRGEWHHLVTECLKNRITVFIDGEKVYELKDDDFQDGAVGFRVNEPLDQGLFNNISLQKL